MQQKYKNTQISYKILQVQPGYHLDGSVNVFMSETITKTIDERGREKRFRRFNVVTKKKIPRVRVEGLFEEFRDDFDKPLDPSRGRKRKLDESLIFDDGKVDVSGDCIKVETNDGGKGNYCAGFKSELMKFFDNEKECLRGRDFGTINNLPSEFRYTKTFLMEHTHKRRRLNH